MKNKIVLNSVKNLINTVPIYKIQFFSNEIVVFVDPKKLFNLIHFFKYHTLLQYKVLSCVSGVDYPNKKLRFENSYDFLSLIFNHRLRVKVMLNEVQSLDSCIELFPASGWFECEVWDMYGIFFQNHTNLRRILTDYGFEGHPLRKDFPLNGFVELRYNENSKRVLNESIEFSQEYRTFNFFGPWGTN